MRTGGIKKTTISTFELLYVWGQTGAACLCLRIVEATCVNWIQMASIGGFRVELTAAHYNRGLLAAKHRRNLAAMGEHLGSSSDTAIQIGVASFGNHCYKASNGINCLRMALTSRNVAPNQLASNGIKWSQHATACIKLGLIQPVHMPYDPHAPDCFTFSCLVS